MHVQAPSFLNRAPMDFETAQDVVNTCYKSLRQGKIQILPINLTVLVSEPISTAVSGRRKIQPSSILFLITPSVRNDGSSI
mgnify:CR=1 FL=1